jgi:hypothetical protein
MTSYTHTVHVSRDVYQQIESLAAAKQQSVDALVDETLQRSLPPSFEQIPERFRIDLAQLALMSDEMLWRMSRSELPVDKSTSYQSLLAIKHERDLTTQEQSQLDILREEADLLMFRRSYALLLLKRRGHQMPPLSSDE